MKDVVLKIYALLLASSIYPRLVIGAEKTIGAVGFHEFHHFRPPVLATPFRLHHPSLYFVLNQVYVLQAFD